MVSGDKAAYSLERAGSDIVAAINYKLPLVFEIVEEKIPEVTAEMAAVRVSFVTKK